MARPLRPTFPGAAYPPPLVFVSADDRLVKTGGEEHLLAENPEKFA